MTFAYARTVPINKNYCGMTFAYARTVPEMYVQELCQPSVAKAVPITHDTVLSFYHGKPSQVKRKEIFLGVDKKPFQ
jgi:hypothetical protein